MKKILYSAAIAAIMMTSCQKTDVLNVVGDLIEFGTEVGKLTKADGEGEGTVTNPYAAEKFATLKDQGFRVWVVSDFTSDPHVAGTIYNSMDGLDVKYDESWKYVGGGKYMWPQSGQFLHFYTISSNNVTWLNQIKNQNKFIPTEASSSTSVTEVTMPDYTVDSPANDDIMVANHIRQDKTIKHVDPVFRHTMTKVEFNFVKGAPSTNGGSNMASTVILKGIETSLLNDKGTLKVQYATTGVSFEWQNPSGSKAFSKNGSDIVTIAKAGGDIITESTEAPTATPTAESLPVVVYNKDTDGKITSADVYEIIATTEGDNTNYDWSIETHTLTNGSWTGNDDDKYQTVNGFVLRTETDIKKENEDAKYDNFATWYMVPQILTAASLGDDGNDDGFMRDPAGAFVTIHYIADGKHLSQNFNLNVGENDSTAKDWNEEHCVRYNVTIAPHKIDFKPIVGGWDTTNQVPEMNN